MGVLGQLGFASETQYGTAVTVDKFYAGYVSDNPVREQPPLISAGIVAGRHTPHCVSTGAKTVSGNFSLELQPAPLATLLSHMLGSVTTSGTGPFTHEASPGDVSNKSFTAQVGIESSRGVVHPFTYSGCRLQGWELGASAGEIATLSLDVIARDYETSTGLAAASYGSFCPFTFVHGSVSVGGTQLGEVNSFSLAATIPRRVKHGVGSTLIMNPRQNGRREHTITVESEFEDLTLHDLANQAVTVELEFDNGTDSLTIVANTFVIPSTPTVAGVDSENTFTFSGVCMSATDDAAAITATLVNSETTA